MTKKTYIFKEINSGSIEIETEKTLTDDEVINEIWKGKAEYNSIKYDDIKLVRLSISPPYKNNDTAHE